MVYNYTEKYARTVIKMTDYELCSLHHMVALQNQPQKIRYPTFSNSAAAESRVIETQTLLIVGKYIYIQLHRDIGALCYY